MFALSRCGEISDLDTDSVCTLWCRISVVLVTGWMSKRYEGLAISICIAQVAAYTQCLNECVSEFNFLTTRICFAARETFSSKCFMRVYICSVCTNIVTDINICAKSSHQNKVRMRKHRRYRRSKCDQ